MKCTCLILLAAPVVAFQVGPSLSRTSFGGVHLAPHRQLTLQTRQAVAVPLDEPTTMIYPEKLTKSVAARDAWVENLDYDAFRKDVNALGKELLANMGDDDVEHLHKILAWRNIAAIVGISTMWIAPNPLTIAALSTWTYASWTMGKFVTKCVMSDDER